MRNKIFVSLVLAAQSIGVQAMQPLELYIEGKVIGVKGPSVIKGTSKPNPFQYSVFTVTTNPIIFNIYPSDYIKPETIRLGVIEVNEAPVLPYGVYPLTSVIAHNYDVVKDVNFMFAINHDAHKEAFELHEEILPVKSYCYQEQEGQWDWFETGKVDHVKDNLYSIDYDHMPSKCFYGVVNHAEHALKESVPVVEDVYVPREATVEPATTILNDVTQEAQESELF
ncbi:hypothetical protein [Vibrio barjaei]|uniref:hypothetical protein n=1 Tax=Vibrio barjaei TaxID=1676683 RepID=UPI002283B5A6|nr:hypothetical protein [Vibrio barjaei]MCY9872352.1 hypothetical protein [Vibrio barjaei]